MLNVQGQAGASGTTMWDRVRKTLAAETDALFQAEVGGSKVEDVVLFGLIVFGHNQPDPGEQKVVVGYGPDQRANIAWALGFVGLMRCGM